MENWFDSQNIEGENSPHVAPQSAPVVENQNNMEDFFGSQADPQPASSGYPNNFNQNSFNNAFDNQGDYEPVISSSTPAQISRLKKLEKERMKQMYLKEQAERNEKMARIDKAKQELLQWKQERLKTIESRKKMNRESQEVLSKGNKDEYKNSWEKIVNNVSIKESDYPGAKDVSAMRTAILNKRTDMALIK